MKPAGVLHADPPTLNPERAADVARSLFGVDSHSARQLVSERDQNFLVDEADGSRWVLKVSNAAEDPGVVAMEVATVEHVARMDPDLPVPRARPTSTATWSAAWPMARRGTWSAAPLPARPDRGTRGLDATACVASGG